MSPLSIFFVFMFLLFGLMAPRNPDYNFPVSMELIIIGFLHLALAFKRKPPAGYRIVFTKQEKRLFYAALFLLVVIVTPRALYSVGIYGPVPNYCKAAGMNFQIIECLMQTAINGPYGLRTLFQNYCALYILVLTIYLFREPSPPPGVEVQYDEKKPPVGLVILSVWMTIFVLASFWLQYLGVNTVLPEWLTYTQLPNRLSSIIANPGWVWPYISVGFVAALALATSRVRNSWLYAVPAVICGLGMLATQQRGVLLAFAIMAVAALLVPAISKVLAGKGISRRTLWRTGLGLVCISAVVVTILVYPRLLNDIASLVGYSFKTTDLKSGRFGMWAAAADIISSAPAWGHGYAGWLKAIANYNATIGRVQVYDTAHNFYIQLAVELGLLFVMAHVVLLIGTVRNAIDSQPRLGKRFVVLFIACTFAVTLVQEVDYIRPVFYVFSFGLGVAIAMRNLSYIAEDDSSKARVLAKIFQTRILQGRWGAAAGAMFLAVGCYAIYVFNLNVYPYEFHNSPGAPVKMTRWLGVTSKVSTGRGLSGGGYYAYYPNAETMTKGAYSVELLNGSMPGFPLSGISPHQPLITAVGSAFSPAQTQVTFKGGGSDGTRVMTKKIGYPVIYANSFLIPYRGGAKLEFVNGKVRVRCKNACDLIAASCGRRGQASLAISAKPDNLNISYKISGLDDSSNLGELIKSASFEGKGRTVSISQEKPVAAVYSKNPNSNSGLVAFRFQVHGGKHTSVPREVQGVFYVHDGPCDKKSV